MNKTNLHCPTCLHHLYLSPFGYWCVDCGQFVDEEDAMSADEARMAKDVAEYEKQYPQDAGAVV